MKSTHLATILLGVGTAGAAHAAAFGELPPGARSTNVVSDVQAEICRDHLIEPSFVKSQLPTGYRLVLADEYAQGDPSVASFLKASDAKYKSYAVGSLCFMSVGSFVVDGTQLTKGTPTPMAFWWVRAAGPRDPRMQGRVDWVQLASWYSRNIAHQDKVVATDPMAQFVDIEVKKAETGKWQLSMALPNETIEAEVGTEGPLKKRSAREPGFMSVPFSGKHAGSVWIITYYGHHHQSAKGQWRAKGAGVFSSALSLPNEATAFGTIFQNGWSALSGLY
jgi:hypothetical protein